VCARAISKNPELAECLIEHSQQNGIEWGMDINANIGDGQNLLRYAVLYENYPIFKKLLQLNANPFIKGDDLMKAIVSTPFTTSKLSPEEINQKLEIRTAMLQDLLEIGITVSKEVFEATVEWGEASMIHILAESASGKKLITPKYVKSVMENEQIEYSLRRNSGMQTELMVLYNKQRILEALIKSKESTEAEKMVTIGKENLEEEVLKQLQSPEVLAEIVEKILKEHGEKITQDLVTQIKQYFIANPSALVKKILR